MEIKINNMGFKPDIKVVKEYIEDTGNTFYDVSKLEEVEKFALWVFAKHIQLPTPTAKEGDQPEDQEAQKKYWRDVVRARIKYFEGKYHSYEAGELQAALDAIDRLVPPLSF